MYPYPESKRTTQKYWETATSIDLYFIPYIYMWNIYIYAYTHIYTHLYTYIYMQETLVLFLGQENLLEKE